MAEREKISNNGTFETPIRETYKGKEIVIHSPEESRTLMASSPEHYQMLLIEIDSQRIEVLQEGSNEYHSVLLPYKAYESPLELAKDVIDYVPSFMPEAQF